MALVFCLPQSYAAHLTRLAVSGFHRKFQVQLPFHSDSTLESLPPCRNWLTCPSVFSYSLED